MLFYTLRSIKFIPILFKSVLILFRQTVYYYSKTVSWHDEMWIFLCDRHFNQWRSIKIRNIEIWLPAPHTHTTHHSSKHETSNSCIVLELELTPRTCQGFHEPKHDFSYSSSDWRWIYKYKYKMLSNITLCCVQCCWSWCFPCPGHLQTREWSTASSGPASWLWGSKIEDIRYHTLHSPLLYTWIFIFHIFRASDIAGDLVSDIAYNITRILMFFLFIKWPFLSLTKITKFISFIV